MGVDYLCTVILKKTLFVSPFRQFVKVVVCISVFCCRFQASGEQSTSKNGKTANYIRNMEYFASDPREFARIQPRTRKERNAHKDKEAREKQLLENRPPVKGVKFINYGRHLTSASEGTVMHITEQDRFYTDFAEEEKIRRDGKVKEKNAYIEQKRSSLMEQEEARWKSVHDEWAKKEARELARRERGVPSNTSSVPYDPLTLQYKQTEAGERLRYADNQIRYRSSLRAENLRRHQTSEDYNPITGEPLRRIPLPEKPTLNLEKYRQNKK